MIRKLPQDSELRPATIFQRLILGRRSGPRRKINTRYPSAQFNEGKGAVLNTNRDIISMIVSYIGTT